MSREKQIEEMAKAMCGNGMSNGNCAIDDEPCHLECVYGCCAERLHAKGYRKQSEGEWLDNLYCSVCGYCYDTGEYSNSRNFCPNCGAKMMDERR